MPVHHIEVAMPLSAPEAYEISITKDERVLDTLHQWRQKKISASAINKYLSCQKQFYYRYVLGIHEPPPEEDISISAITLGNVFHDSRETLYGEYINKIVTESTIETIEQSLTEERFEQLLAEISIDIVATNVVKQYILNTLAYDKTLTPFIYLGSEQFVHHSLDIPGIGSIAFGGYIDRVDIIQDRLRLIDYKTGSPKDLHYTSMEKVFQQNQHNEKALQTLLYCWMMSHSSFPFLQRAQQIEPHLYYLRNMSDPSQVSTQVCKIKKEDFCFTPEVEQEFTEFLTKLIQEIFNPEVRIEPTTEQKTTCEYCAYSELCKR